MKLIIARIAALVLGVCISGQVIAATTQLPPGEQCFQTAVGPVSSGSINMYQPNTTVPKPTWQDAGQVVANTQPIQLDANGCAIIYGTGVYRQQLFTGPVVGGVTTGNLVFDLLTTDTSAFNSTFWSGLSGGTPNVITINDPGFNGTGGSVINFKAVNTSTGPVTINPSGFGAIPVVVDTSIGPVPLTGGEIVQNNTLRIIYDPILNAFHLTNPATTSGGGGTTGLPVGTEVSCTGFAAPANFVFESGQALSRTTFATLFAQETLAQAGNTTSGSPIVTSLTTTEQLAVGQNVEGPGIPAATTILTVDSSSQIHLSANATITQTASLTFFAYPNGDGVTTFNVPDRRGRTLVGRDNMGNSVAGVLTSAFTTNNPDALGTKMTAANAATGGGVSFQIANLPNTTFPVTIPAGQGSHSHSINLNFPGGAGNAPVANDNGVLKASNGGVIVPNTLPGMSGTAATGGSGTGLSIIQPGATTNWCLKVQ